MMNSKRLFKGLGSSLALMFSLSLLAPLQAEEVHLDRIAAVVNNDVVMESELTNQLELVRQQLISRNTPLPPDSILVRQVLDRLILDNIQLQMAREQGIKIDDQSLNRSLSRIASNRNMSLQEFKTALELQGQSYQYVREQVREEMLISQLQQLEINRRIQITDLEVQNFLESEQGQRQESPEVRLGHILVAVPSEASPEEIQNAQRDAQEIYRQLINGADFAQLAVARSGGQNALQGGDMGWRKLDELPSLAASHVKNLEAGELTKPIRSSSGFHLLKVMDKRGGKERLVKQTHARHILIKPTEIRSQEEAEQEARRLYQQLLNGADFTALAEAHSDDTGSAAAGGDLGWALPGQMVPAFEEQMERAAVGQIVEPFETRFGWHVLQVLERKQEDLGAQIRANEARETLRRRKFDAELQNWLREIKAQAYIEIKS